MQTKGLKKFELDKKVTHENLIYKYKGKISDKKFDEYDNALDLIDKIKNGKITLTNAKNDQENFNSSLDETKKGSKKSKKQKNVIYNIIMFYNAIKIYIKN